MPLKPSAKSKKEELMEDLKKEFLLCPPSIQDVGSDSGDNVSSLSTPGMGGVEKSPPPLLTKGLWSSSLPAKL